MIFIMGGLVAFCVVFYLFFHRDPERKIPWESNIVSPADGRVRKIIESTGEAAIKKGRLGKITTTCREIGKECIIIIIVMRLWDVHVQRSPITGIIEKQTYLKGRLKSALHGKIENRMIENERNEIVMRGNEMKIKVIQIAGLVAKRVVSFVKEGKKVIKGQRIGIIRLGSQVAVILPKEKVKITIHENQKVYAGETVIATYT